MPSYLDLGVLGVVLISALLSMMRGFTREVLAIGSWAAAAAAAYYFYPYVQHYLDPYIHKATIAQAAAASCRTDGPRIMTNGSSDMPAALARKTPAPSVTRCQRPVTSGSTWKPSFAHPKTASTSIDAVRFAKPFSGISNNISQNYATQVRRTTAVRCVFRRRPALPEMEKRRRSARCLHRRSARPRSDHAYTVGHNSLSPVDDSGRLATSTGCASIPVFKMAHDIAPSHRELCSQSTISRLKNRPDVRALLRIGRAMVDLYCASFKQVPNASCSISTTRSTPFMAVNAYYDEYGLQPIVVCDRPLRPFCVPSDEVNPRARAREDSTSSIKLRLILALFGEDGDQRVRSG